MNRSTGQIRVQWDTTEFEANQPLPDTHLKALRASQNDSFDLEQFGDIDPDTILSLFRLVENEAYCVSSNATSPTVTPSVSASDNSTSSNSRPPLGERIKARAFAGFMVQSAMLRFIMLYFGSTNVGQVNSAREVLQRLVAEASKASSLEIGVNLMDLNRSANILLASAMGQATQLDSSHSLSNESIALETSDEDLEEDLEDDEEMSTDEDDTIEEPISHGRARNAIEQLLEEHHARETSNGGGLMTTPEPLLPPAPLEATDNPTGRRMSILRPSRFGAPQRFTSSTTSSSVSAEDLTVSPHPPLMAPPNPPPPPPQPPAVTNLAEMGFALDHINSGIQRLNLTPTHMNPNQIAMLASWLIENPAPEVMTPSQPVQETEAEENTNSDETNDQNDIQPLLFEFETDERVADAFELIDQPSTTRLVEESTPETRWPNNVIPQPRLQHPNSILAQLFDVEDGNVNERLKGILHVFRSGEMANASVEDLTQGLQSMPKKLNEIARDIGLVENDIPDSVTTENPDPLGENRLFMKDILDDKFETNPKNAKELMTKYRLSQMIGQTKLNWTEKCHIMSSILVAVKVLTARAVVLRTLAMAAVQRFEKIAPTLKQFGLDDVNLLVKLLYLSAATKEFMPKNSKSSTILDQETASHTPQFPGYVSIKHLKRALEALAADPEKAETIIDIITKVNQSAK
ncbi:unnamed protein product [Oikopleura dioica]|uniref:Uncharacterized protein n=1 Tax=Oikopleura dioica TaxID=34765 RepID=E4YV05_OIKDI|nr:unnamed protein product [Oikopleura dioica]